MKKMEELVEACYKNCDDCCDGDSVSECEKMDEIVAAGDAVD
jgi:hypothetical protein